MSNVKIYYFDFNQNKLGEQSLYRERDLYDDNFVYTKCPVFNHKSNRTFVAFSPIDYELRVDRANQRYLTDNDDYLFYDKDHFNSPRPVVQLSFPKFLFWTENSNVWFEYKDHPMTSLNNNFVGVGGWFNLTNWPRSTSNSFTVIEEQTPVKIKKGDPLFRVCFYPPNLNSGVILKKISDSATINAIREQYLSRNNKKENWKTKLFSKTGIKTCPFKFLHNK